MMRPYKELRKEEKPKAKEKRRDIPFECRVPRRNKKAFLSDQCNEIEENKRMGKIRDLFNKLEISREHFMQR